MAGILGKKECWWNLCLVILWQYCSALKILSCIWSGHWCLKFPISQKWRPARSACKMGKQGASARTGAGGAPWPGTPGRGVAGRGRGTGSATASAKPRMMKWIDLRNLVCMSSWIKCVALFVYVILLVKTTDSCLWVRKISPSGTKRFNFSELLNNGLRQWFITDHLKFNPSLVTA